MAKIYLPKIEKEKLRNIILTQSESTGIENTIVMKKIYKKHINYLKKYLIDDIISIIENYVNDLIYVHIICKLKEKLSPDNFCIGIGIVIHNTYINYKYYDDFEMNLLIYYNEYNKEKILCYLLLRTYNIIEAYYLNSKNGLFDSSKQDISLVQTTSDTTRKDLLTKVYQEHNCTNKSDDNKKIITIEHIDDIIFRLMDTYNDVITECTLTLFFNNYMNEHYKKHNYINFKSGHEVEYYETYNHLWSKKNNKDYYQSAIIKKNPDNDDKEHNKNIVDYIVYDHIKFKNVIVITKILINSIVSIIKNISKDIYSRHNFITRNIDNNLIKEKYLLDVRCRWCPGETGIESIEIIKEKKLNYYVYKLNIYEGKSEYELEDDGFINQKTYTFNDIKSLSKKLQNQLRNHYKNGVTLKNSLQFILNMNFINFIKQLNINIIFAKIKKNISITIII